MNLRGPLYTRAKGRDRVMVRALDFYLKAMPFV